MIFALSPQAKGRVERRGNLPGPADTELRQAVLKSSCPIQPAVPRPVDPAFRLAIGARSCASNTRGEWPRFSCCLRQHRTMPVRLSWCCTDWTAGCRYNMTHHCLPRRRRLRFAGNGIKPSSGDAIDPQGLSAPPESAPESLTMVRQPVMAPSSTMKTCSP